MFLTLVGWLLIVSSIAIPALLVAPLWVSGARRQKIDQKPRKARLEDVVTGLAPGQLSRGASTPLIAGAAVFLLVAGVGAITSHVKSATGATASEDATSVSAPFGSDGEMLTRLENYARSNGTETPAQTSPAAASGNMLPDVNTMIERLATRLEATPGDVQGWRMLGWSYLNTGRNEEATSAYAKAVELDPSSAELKAAYEDAKARASESEKSKTGSPVQIGAAGKTDDGPSAEQTANAEVAPPHDTNAAIRSMVDGLANRLESSPRDVEGWTQLMRSRVVLGEREVAATAFRKALDVFKDDSAASREITAAASELGLKTE